MDSLIQNAEGKGQRAEHKGIRKKGYRHLRIEFYANGIEFILIPEFTRIE
jgi:hypothetical protein